MISSYLDGSRLWKQSLLKQGSIWMVSDGTLSKEQKKNLKPGIMKLIGIQLILQKSAQFTNRDDN